MEDSGGWRGLGSNVLQNGMNIYQASMYMVRAGSVFDNYSLFGNEGGRIWASTARPEMNLAHSLLFDVKVYPVNYADNRAAYSLPS